MVTEYMKHENLENGWELHEIRTFGNDDSMLDALLLVLDSKTKEYVVDEKLQDDVWKFNWEAVSQLEKFYEMTIAEVSELKNLS